MSSSKVGFTDQVTEEDILTKIKGALPMFNRKTTKRTVSIFMG